MQHITSTQNHLIKHVKSLHEKKARYLHDEFLVEGMRSVVDSVVFLLPLQIFVTESKLVQLIECINNKLDSCKLQYKLNINDIVDKIITVDEVVINNIVDTVNTQGVVGVFRLPRIEQSNLDHCNNLNPSNDYILYFDKIQDPGNLGALVRSAVAFGFLDIVLDDCVDLYNTKSIRASMSSFLYVNCYYKPKVQDLKAIGYKIIVADSGGCDYNNINKELDIKRDKICFVVGNEGNGVSLAIKKNADIVVGIPMDSIESLNVSVAGSIIMAKLYALKRLI